MSKDRPLSSSKRGPAASPGLADPANAGVALPASTPLEDGRDAAIRHLSRLAARYPDLSPEPLKVEGLDTREAALAHTIVDQAVRRWLTIEHLIRVCAMREPSELEPRMRAALLSGSVQLLFLDRIPDHAAIDRTVEWAKTRVRPGAAGITNAVLRRVAGVRATDGERTRILRDGWNDQRDELPLASGGALALAGEALPTDPIDRWAISTGMPRELVARWASRMGEIGARDLALHGLVQPPTILNVTHARGPIEDEAVEPHSVPGFCTFSGDRLSLHRLLESRPDIWVQDSASGEAVNAIAALSLERIVDVCAGRGTKTRQILATFPHARILASDTDAARLADLRRGLSGQNRAQVVDARDLAQTCAGRADLALLDVPCSNTGVLSRRPEARHRFGTDQSARLLDVQRSIFELAMTLVRPGGWILYSTCSLEPEENEELVARAAARFSLGVEGMSHTVPCGLPGEPPHAYRDGSFWALLVRR